MTASRFVVALNLIALALIAAMLTAAFVDQLVLHELPCPLCLLQRAALLVAALGFMLNVRFGVRPLHYGLTIMAALVGAAVAVRQVLLHIAPGDPGFGTPFWGLHLYTWALIAFGCIVFGVAGLLSLPDPLDAEVAPRRRGRLADALMILITLLMAANLGSTLLECGFSQCPDDPVHYEWINGVTGLPDRGSSPGP